MFLVVLKALFLLFIGILSSCRDKGLVLESLNLIFTSEVNEKIVTFLHGLYELVLLC
jgi:hypothetical protein